MAGASRGAKRHQTQKSAIESKHQTSSAGASLRPEVTLHHLRCFVDVAAGSAALQRAKRACASRVIVRFTTRMHSKEQRLLSVSYTHQC